MGPVPTVLKVTDASVHVLSGGSGRRPAGSLVEAALDWIDDPVGLFDERPVAVPELWRSLVDTLLGPRCDSVVLVYPPDWPRSRVDRVVAAANTVAERIEAVCADRWQGTDPPAARLLPRRGNHPYAAGLVLAAGVLLAGGLAVSARPGLDAGRPAARTVVEGQMTVRVPAQWDVKRVTGGPGSRRLQATSPADPGIVVHITWSYVPETTLADTADVLARAIAAESAGVFVELRADATVSDRAAVTYRENRPGRVIAWTVVQDGSTRISIGCQSPPEREQDVRAACDDAVRSAREV